MFYFKKVASLALDGDTNLQNISMSKISESWLVDLLLGHGTPFFVRIQRKMARFSWKKVIYFYFISV